MAGTQQRARRQQRVEALCATTLRALTGDAALHFRSGRLHRDAWPVPVHAPHLRLDAGRDDFDAARGVTDALALRERFSDRGAHRRLSPEEPVERLLFELLEQLRVEARVPPTLPGVANNVARRFEAWSREFHRSGLTETGLGILLYTVAQLCWSRLMARPVLADTEDLIEATRAAIVPALGGALAGLRRDRDDQVAYARHAHAIARIVAESIHAARAQAEPADRDENEGGAQAAFALLLDFDRDDEGSIATAASGESKAFAPTGSGYRIFTTRYDREVAAASLVRAALLRECRERLDRRIGGLAINVPQLARRLAAVLAEPRRDGWRYGEEEGYVDGRRIAQLVASPAERRIFRAERHRPVADCVVGVLIDCSGSMKAHAETVAVLVDVLARALEMAGAATEVLGFTTGAWHGGRAHRDWLAAGRPRDPGRLAEVCHLVFKPADRAWRSARADIAALLKADLFREGVDGEAVEWACTRLRARDAGRRILIVISDGCPMDAATQLANDSFYLDHHLKQVVARHERAGEVEIHAVGVGLDLSPFYRHSLAIDPDEPVDNRSLCEIVRLIGRR